MEAHQPHHEFVVRLVLVHLQVELGVMKGRQRWSHVVGMHQQ